MTTLSPTDRAYCDAWTRIAEIAEQGAASDKLAPEDRPTLATIAEHARGCAQVRARLSVVRRARKALKRARD